jgi:hypothetical protein
MCSAGVVLLRRGAPRYIKGRHVGLLCLGVDVWEGKGHEREAGACLVCVGGEVFFLMRCSTSMLLPAPVQLGRILAQLAFG